MENEMYEFDLEVSKKLNKETNEEFLVFRALTKENGWINLKFTRDVPVETLPQKSGKLKVRFGKINLNRQGRYPVFWVSEIAEFVAYSTVSQNLDKYF